MNNQSPINMLTTVGKEFERQAQVNNNSQTLNDGQQRQLALASLFNSLSSLAANNSNVESISNHHQHQQQQQIPIQAQQQHQHQQNTFYSQQQPTIIAQDSQQQTPPPPTSFASLQSVMAAAMMQQQLATAVSQQQQQHLQTQANFLRPDQQTTGSIFTQARLDTQDNVQLSSQQQEQHQHRINYCTICNKELCNKYFMKTHMLKMHGINLEMEQPEGEDADGEGDHNNDRDTDDDDERDKEEEEDDDDDENKSSRLKVNKSNVETIGQMNSECSLNNRANSNSNNNNWSTNDDHDRKKGSQINSKKNNSQAISNKMNINPQKKSNTSSSSSSSSSSSTNKQTTSVMNGFAGNSMGGVVCDICNKELCSKYFLKVHKQNTHGIMTDYQDAANQFIYPFPSPSLAGHPAANPFMGPPGLPTSLAAAAVASPFLSNPIHSLLTNQQNQHQHQHQQSIVDDYSSSVKKSQPQPGGGAKRLRISGGQSNTSQPCVGGGETSLLVDCSMNESNNSAAPNKQFESVYRLILAQQQQQTPQQAPSMLAMDPMSAAAAISTATNTNPLGALMCFGAMAPPAGPFGPTGMSPAMIVDNILRNQHLFNRNNNNNNNNAVDSKALGSQSRGKQTDRNNNNSNNESKQQSNANGNIKGSSSGKDSTSNSRYFSHYTEACPMCDRRFKSIKWLKTHMMNDHKQEIGAYMQMMMQYLYTSKSQQMAAAATIAAFEQQQQQQQQQQLLANQFKNHGQQQQQPQPQPISLSSKCFTTAANSHFHHHHHQNQPQQPQQPPANMMIDQGRYNQKDLINPFQRQQQQQQQQQQDLNEQQQESSREVEDSFIIDARCRQESLSPNAGIQNNSTPSSSIGSQLGCPSDSHLIYNLNFELGSKLNEGELKEAGGFLLSHNLNDNDSSDIAGDDSRDSDHQSKVLEVSEDSVNKPVNASGKNQAQQSQQQQQQQQQMQIKTTSS